MIIKLYNGDCLEIMEQIPDKSIDMVLCDLPYGTTNCSWDIIIPFEKLWKQYNRIIKDNGAVVLFGQEPFSSYLRISNIKDYKYDLYWEKERLTNIQQVKRRPGKTIETISVFYKKQPTYNPQKTTGHKLKTSFKKKELQTDVYNKTNKDNYYSSTERYPRSILEFSSDTQISSLHPNQKPIKLLEYLIKTYTNEGDLVFDNTMGSGSTGVACLNTNREFIGIEKEEKYFNIAKERIEERSREI